MTKYILTGPEGQRAAATSERETRRIAREWLGAAAVTETPTTAGWQLWDRYDLDDHAPCVTVKVA